MMKAVGLTAILLFLNAPTFAADEKVSADPCEYVVTHTPDDNVMYTPGVDVQGNKVTPAEIKESNYETPETLIVPLEVELKNLLENKDLDLDTIAGEVKVNTKTGRAMLNDEDITSTFTDYCQSTEDGVKSTIE